MWNRGVARFAFSTACSAGLDTGRLSGGGRRNLLETAPGWRDENRSEVCLDG